MLKNVDAANAKAKYLLDKMRERFPEKLCSIEIMHWEDETFSVNCRHCDDSHVMHEYRYTSSNKETRYIITQLNKDACPESHEKILSNEIISW